MKNAKAKKEAEELAKIKAAEEAAILKIAKEKADHEKAVAEAKAQILKE